MKDYNNIKAISLNRNIRLKKLIKKKIIKDLEKCKLYKEFMNIQNDSVKMFWNYQQ